MAAEFSVGDVELCENVARGECHGGDVGGVPSAKDDASTGWVGEDEVDALLDLVDAKSGVVVVHVCVGGTEVSPLETVDGSEVAGESLGESV